MNETDFRILHGGTCHTGAYALVCHRAHVLQRSAMGAYYITLEWVQY